MKYYTVNCFPRTDVRGILLSAREGVTFLWVQPAPGPHSRDLSSLPLSWEGFSSPLHTFLHVLRFLFYKDSSRVSVSAMHCWEGPALTQGRGAVP